jgi:magnesium-transporting ATPase (P-type)
MPVGKNANWSPLPDAEPGKEEMKLLSLPMAPGAAAQQPHKEEDLTEKNMGYMGCDVTQGRGRGLVVKTGMHTKMGDISHLLATAEGGDSPLQLKLHKLVRRPCACTWLTEPASTLVLQGVRLGLASLACSAIVFIIGTSTGACAIYFIFSVPHLMHRARS